MKKLVYTLLGMVLVSAIGCQKDPYPYITIVAKNKIDSLVHPAITNAAFIYKNNIYYVADFTKPVTQVTTDGTAAKFVKISHDHSKFAYQNFSNVIVIVDSKGALITSLPQYSGVNSFDWSPDDKTLYILNNSTMAYYGPAMNLPAFVYPGIDAGVATDIVSASVSMKGDFAYAVHSFDFFNGDAWELVIAPANNGKVFAYSNPDNTGNPMDYVNFSSNLQDLVVGYGGPSHQGSLDCFTSLKNYPDFTYGGGNAATPVYNSTLYYIVAGYKDPNNNNADVPGALYLGLPSVYADANVAHSIALYKYAMLNGILYIDWK